MLHGFDISHFRNFGENPQVIAPLGKINVFIGSNNSGKSNVLRYIRDYLRPLLADPNGRNIKPISLENRSRFTLDEPDAFRLYFPIPDELIDKIFPARFESHKPNYRKIIRSLPNSISSGEYFGVNIRQKPSGNNRILTDDKLPDNVDLHALCSMVEVTGGGRLRPLEALAHVERRIALDRIPSIEVIYVPAFRQIKTRLTPFANEYESDTKTDKHIIDQLVEFSNPTYDQQHKKESFLKLRDFIADITLIEDIQIDIPHDRSTINVEIDGFKRPIETLGSGLHELFMLASQIVLNEGKVILLEEPELHLHPDFQRKLISFIQNKIESQFFITTHSAAIIDTPGAAVFGVRCEKREAQVEPLLRNQRRHDVFRELGYKASDLLQSNCLIWVEGPSDRIYLNYYIKQRSKSLREGIEYSIMFYGGRLLSNLTADDSLVDEFISLLCINRKIAILIDSDLGSASQNLNATKSRIIAEVNANAGYTWVTDGREVENYVPPEVRLKAIKKVHPTAVELCGSPNRFGKPLDFKSDSGQRVSSGFNKIRIAREAVEIGYSLDEFDLSDKIDSLVAFIKTSNQ